MSVARFYCGRDRYNAQLVAGIRALTPEQLALRHTRQSVLIRLLGHDGYHSGEVSLVLGSNGLAPVDLWPPAGPAGASAS